jgi:hypothetical protein
MWRKNQIRPFGVGNFKNGDYDYEQYEIELLPTYLEDAAIPSFSQNGF